MKFITQNTILENIDVVTRPIFHLDEIDSLYEDVMKNLDKNLTISPDILNSFQIKDTLNPEIWENTTLSPKVKIKLLKAGTDFFKDLELPSNVKIKDILFVGSLANYNWSKFSDIDLHIVIDFSQLDGDQEQTKKNLDNQTKLWNLKHNINIHKYPVEIYIQDTKEKLESSAIYSIPHDKWIAKPTKEKFKLDKPLIKRKVQKLFDKLNDIKQDYTNDQNQKVIDKVGDLKDHIKKMRKSGLESGGEYSTENLVFKVLRRTSFMEILSTYKDKAYDKIISLEEDQP